MKIEGSPHELVTFLDTFFEEDQRPSQVLGLLLQLHEELERDEPCLEIARGILNTAIGDLYP